jgi:hypothetical protein
MARAEPTTLAQLSDKFGYLTIGCYWGRDSRRIDRPVGRGENAAVDGQFDAGDMGGGIGCEEAHTASAISSGVPIRPCGTVQAPSRSFSASSARGPPAVILARILPGSTAFTCTPVGAHGFVPKLECCAGAVCWTAHAAHTGWSGVTFQPTSTYRSPRPWRSKPAKPCVVWPLATLHVRSGGSLLMRW